MKKIFAVPFLCLFLIACGPENKSNVSYSDLAKQAKATEAAKQSNFAYKNDKYSFALKTFPKDFEVNYLPDNTGISFKKFVKMDPKKNYKNPDFNYNVDIYILPTENTQNYKDLNDMIGKKYQGYSFRFVDYGGISGYFVDDGVYTNATPHFFAMNKGASVIYQVDMKLPSRYYPAQKEAFEALVKSLMIF
ncbi:hypothetical protein HZA40_01955 [Candidatus Peregrinibacteria bacterium]|nr:hypothetical protein [Candidatus Peregrinibacteria bacterium]